MSEFAPYVIDTGESSVKVGFAGDELPKCVVPSLVGSRRLASLERKGLPTLDETTCGLKAAGSDPLKVDIRSPISRGVVKSWEEMEILWRHVFAECDVNPKGRPALLAEVPLCPGSLRRKTAEIFFETFNVSAISFLPQAVLAMFSTGTTTGLVLDCGEGLAHAVPMCDGYFLRESVHRSEIAGRDVTRHLHQELQRNGCHLTPGWAREVLRTFKESECYVADDLQQEVDKIREDGDTSKLFRLPDGKGMIPLGAERCRAPEVLLAPRRVGSDCDGLHKLVIHSVRDCDLNLRSRLLGQMVFAGGSTLFRGLGERMFHELRNTVPADVKIRISAPNHRQFSAWIGGSVIASLGTFGQVAVSKAQYEERGPTAFDSGALWAW
eukprot:CAMPEP_0117469512 /NCGR_PEP_ID=MMETSP0784-20121206/6729_1 /TAXON_ID=39447 /ORGANISM="" /LENGTH=380 /DNA_ID=CAMNT_0005263553 /DNA_START=21 /DNA_END=1160 /DNA_ORIENTATION=-